MYVELLRLENIRCFDSVELKFVLGEEPFRWITFLSENGGGKSTALQALALLLAGPEGAQQLLPRPAGWLRDEGQPGKLTIRIHQGQNDPGQFGEVKIARTFGYTYFLTGSSPLTIRNKSYTEPSIVESGEKRL